MDIEVLRNWAGTVALLISAASVIIVWIKTPGEKVRAGFAEVDGKIAAVASKFEDKFAAVDDEMTAGLEKIADALREALKGHDRRIQRVEDEMRHLPTKEDLGKVTNAVTKVETQLSTIGKVVDRIDDYLREHK